MARVTYVKKAQQRYATVPVLDDDGNQKRVPVNRKTKTGREVYKRVTVEDKTQPLPPRTCDHCRKPIEVGTPYKWIAPKSGPYGGRRLNRHADCPTWQVWEYSSSLSARIEQIVFSANVSSGGETTVDEFTERANDAATEIRSLAEEKNEAADNIEDGFGHETYQSGELREQAESLESWADDLESLDLDEPPDPDEYVYDRDGEELEKPDEVADADRFDDVASGSYEDAMDEWRDNCQSALDDALQSPL